MADANKIYPEIDEDSSDLEGKNYTRTYDKVSNMINTWLSELDTTIGTALFPSLPIQYTLRKRLIIHRSVSPLWAAWDTLQMVLITLACGLFIASVYDLDYTMNRRMLITDLVVTQFFLFDFMLNWYMHPKLAYWADFMVCVNVYLSVCICVCVCVCVCLSHLLCSH